MGHDSIRVGFRYADTRTKKVRIQNDGAHKKRPSMEGSEMEVRGPGCGKVHAEERTLVRVP